MQTLQDAVRDFLLRAECRREPQQLYRRLVSENPVLALDDLAQLWIVSGYDEIVALSKNPHATTDFKRAGISLDRGFSMARVLEKMLPMRAGADHARLRGLVSTAFSARAAESLRETVRDEIDSLMAPALDRGEFEVIEQLARPLPVALSCAMLGVPASERATVTAWATLISGALYTPVTPPQVRERLEEELPRLGAYIRQLCTERAARPGTDLISILVQANAAGTLDDEELFAFVVMLFVNGLETLTAGLTVAIWDLLRHPANLAAVREHHQRAEAFFDESLRLHAPVRASGRTLTADIRLDEHLLPAGSAVLLLYAAANLDPRRFPDPTAFDPYRRERRHLGFGHGPHHCIGAPLSLIAGGEVIRYFARAFDELRPVLGQEGPEWDTSLAFAGLRRLPVRFTTRAAAPADLTLAS